MKIFCSSLVKYKEQNYVDQLQSENISEAATKADLIKTFQISFKELILQRSSVKCLTSTFQVFSLQL